MIEPSKIQQIQAIWNEYVSRNEDEGIKKILNIDGKTMIGSRT